MYSLKSCVFLVLLLAATSLAEVVDYKPCAAHLNDCTIHEVRVDPCAEAASHAACRIHRRKSATMSFDYTPNFDAETLEAGLVWVKSETEELPLITMDKAACKYTACPVQSGHKQTYTTSVPIESKFPVSAYTIKWSLKQPDGDKMCCFTIDIKVVKKL